MARDGSSDSFKRRHPWASRFLYVWAGLVVLAYPVVRWAGFNELAWAGYYFFTCVGVFAAVMVLAALLDAIRGRRGGSDSER